MFCEHIIFPGLWISNPGFTVKIDNYIFGYCALSAFRLESAIRNRVCDVKDWDYMHTEDWDYTLTLTLTKYSLEQIKIATFVISLGDMLKLLNKEKQKAK